MNEKTVRDASLEYCGTFYAAKLLGLSVGTVQSMVERGELEGWKTKGGHRRISMKAIHAYQEEHGLKPAHMSVSDPFVRVLVVDDDEHTREMMTNLIGSWKLSVDCTVMSSAMEALIDIHNLRPDVLFTDLNMPGVDGLALLRTLRANPTFENLVMVAVTGLTPEEVAERGGLPEHTVLVEKPVNTQWLQGFVTALATQYALRAREA
ncbi:MAG: response regulator [Hydrogenophaga sp.]|uniref:response regulator n=1 Tax=Hydrogenophaga sp. TaxID=1904254 RepID=UPI002AB90421|nr:response regulator [Hydrogenophaga sp.]MDZ4100986.1 response regulator [Hydrogenophaga sp.]MDZ4293524.1 response regulator [Hydrogenophaga sp.]